MYMRVMLQEGVAGWTHINSQWYNNDHYGNLDELVLWKESFNLGRERRGKRMVKVGVVKCNICRPTFFQKSKKTSGPTMTFSMSMIVK